MSQASPLVSILIPAFKPRWFEESLRSAIAQDYANIEIIVFDNCPGEDIRVIAGRYPNVRYWRNPRTRHDNIIDLAAASRGRYLKYLFDDDLLERHCVSSLVAAIARQPEAALAFATSWIIDEEGRRRDLRQYLASTAPCQYFDGNSLCRSIAVDCKNSIGEFSSVLLDGDWCRRNPALISHGLATGTEYRGLIDVICFFNAAAGRPVAFVNEPLSSFRISAESNSNADRNPNYVHVVADWRLLIEEAQAFGLLSPGDLPRARNAYNNLVASVTAKLPGLADQLLPTCFVDDQHPDQQAYLAAVAAIGADRAEEAADALRALAEQNSSHAGVYELLAQLAAAHGDRALAIDCYRIAAEKYGRPGPLTLALVEQLLAAGDLGEAGDRLAGYLDRHPNDEAVRHLFLQCRRYAQPPAAPDPVADPYQRWIDAHRPPEAGGRPRAAAAGDTHRPMFEFVFALDAGDEPLLTATRDSLQAQSADCWCITTFAAGAETAAVNRQLRESHADWIGWFPCGSRFPRHALALLARYIEAHPQWQLIYSDSDEIDAGGERRNPQFKPDINVDLLRAIDYVGGFLVRRDALLAAGGDSDLAGAERYDIFLRVVDAVGEAAVGHIADVLHDCPATLPARAAEPAASEAVRRHLARQHIAARVVAQEQPGLPRRVIYLQPAQPLVTIIIPTRNHLDLLATCLDTLLAHTRYPNWEVVIVDNGSDDPEVLTYYEGLCLAAPDKFRLLSMPGEFNFSAMNNAAADAARGEFLLLLNNDTEAVHDDWLDVMMGHGQRPDVGIVGARLLYPGSRLLQHAGVVLGLDVGAGHVFMDELRPDQPGYLFRAAAEQNYSAVTGACLLIRKSLYTEVAGLDAELLKVSFNDVDLCLKVRQRGYRIVWTPFATLLHHGSRSQKAADSGQRHGRAVERLNAEYLAFTRRWLPLLACDPAWNRNLSLTVTSPTIESELTVSWNPDFHDRPRILGLPAPSSASVPDHLTPALQALAASDRCRCSQIGNRRSAGDRLPTPIELARLAPDLLLADTPIDDRRLGALIRYQAINDDIDRVYFLPEPPGIDARTEPPADQLAPEAVLQRVDRGLRACHRAIAGTGPIAEYCRRFVDAVSVVPAALDPRWSALTAARRTSGKPRVGWLQTGSHQAELQFMAEVERSLAEEVEWVMIDNGPGTQEQCRREFHWLCRNHPDYPGRLAAIGLDLILIPMADNRVNEARSNLPLLEAAMLRWPVICSDILPFQTDSPPATRLPNRTRAWLAAIREHFGEPGALDDRGNRLHDWVERHRTLTATMPQWLAALTRQ